MTPRDETQTQATTQDRCYACSSPRETISLLDTPTGTFCDSCAREFAICPDCGLFLPSTGETDDRFQVCSCTSHRAEAFEQEDTNL